METAGSAALKSIERFTVRQWRLWPEGERWELIGGQPCEPFISPVDVYLPDFPDQAMEDIETVVQPDLMVVGDPAMCQDDGIHGAPDWILEILSPSTAWRDQTEKRQVYEKAGVREYWVLHPDSLDLVIYRFVGGRFAAPEGSNLRSRVALSLFPGLSLQAAD